MVDKIKKLISWIVWPATHIAMHLLLLCVSVRVFKEDPRFDGVKKPLIIISNHRKVFDPWYISFAFPFNIIFGRIFPIRPYSSIYISQKNVILKVLKSLGILHFIYFIYNTISIPDTNSFDDKISPLINAIKNGESVLFFPEGRLTSDESISEFKKGVVRLYELTRVPILPIALSYQKRFFLFSTVYISIGKPIHIPEELLEKGVGNDFYDARIFLREKVLNLYEKMYSTRKA